MHPSEVAAPPQGRTLRSKRSRQAGPDDSVKLPKAKRRRSALRKDTFEPLGTLNPNEVAARPDDHTLPNGFNSENKLEDPPPQNGVGTFTKDLSVRSAQKLKKRGERSGDALKLVIASFSDLLSRWG